MMPHRLSLAVILLLWSSAALADVIQPNSLRAVDNGNGIVLYWTSVDETGVAGYLIERKAGTNGTFLPLVSHPVSVHPSDHNYSYTDDTAFLTNGNFYQYRLTPVNSAGQAVGVSYYVSVTTNATSVRRTWGSIKAMFR